MRSRRPETLARAPIEGELLDGARQLAVPPHIDVRTPAAPELEATARGLDRAVAHARELRDEVARLGAGHAAAGWRLGRFLADVRDRQLWRMRVDADGVSIHKSFEGFVHEEVGITRQHAARLVEAGTVFGEEDARRIGATHMSVIATTPPGQLRDELKKLAEGGAPVRELQARIAETKPARAHAPAKPSVAPSPPKPVPTAPEVARSAPDGDAITIATIYKKTYSAKAFKRPAKLDQLDDEAVLARARKVEDRPVARIELENGNLLTVFVKADRTGDLLVVATFERPKGVRS